MKNIIFALIFSTVAISNVAATEILGSWYDDLGDPSFMDATFIIEEEGGKYFLNRRNGDGSGGRYKLGKRGNRFLKIGDKWGASYVITPAGLELHDRAGFVRLAKPTD